MIEPRIAGTKIDAIVVDVLVSPPELMAYFRRKTDCLVSIDDIGEGRIYADLLFNVIHHPPRPLEASYTEFNDLQFVILRQEFGRAHLRVREVPARVRRVLVSQGGSDTFGGLVEIARALRSIPPDVEIVLLVGTAFKHHTELARVLREIARPFTVMRDVKDMAGLMLTCDLAVTGGGKTAFELAAVGVPFIMVTEESRELETADIVAGQVLCENLGLRAQAGAERIARTVDQLLDDRERREAMSRSGKAAVDGRGAWRTACTIARTWRSRQGTGDAAAV